MLSALRLDVVALVADYAAERDCVTVAEIRAMLHGRGMFAAPPEIAAELRRAGFASGFCFAGKPRPDLLQYENWLHRAVRDWCKGRPCLTVAQFSADHPEIPSDRATRREIAGALGRLGYGRAFVRC